MKPVRPKVIGGWRSAKAKLDNLGQGLLALFRSNERLATLGRGD
jgi:hypothetical protein